MTTSLQRDRNVAEFESFRSGEIFDSSYMAARPLFADEFAACLRRKRLGPGTIRNYVRYMDRYRRWLAAEERGALRSSGLDDMLDFVDTLPVTRSSRESFQNAYRAWWRHMAERSGDCPAEAIRLPARMVPKFNGLERDDVYKLLDAGDAMGPREGLACSLLYFAALRREEAAGLRRTAPADGWLHVMGKGLKPRIVPIHGRLSEALARLEGSRTDEDGWMFRGKREGTHVSPATINLWVRLAGAAAGLGHVRPHQLRKSAGAQMQDESRDLHATGTYLGHSKNSISVTAEVYTRTRQTRLVELMQTL